MSRHFPDFSSQVQVPNGGQRPPCIALEGPTGAGKSSFLDLLVNSHTLKLTQDNDLISSIRITTFTPSTPKSLIHSLLNAAAYSSEYEATLPTITKRLFNLRRDCDFKYIILDEGKHFYNTTQDDESTDRGIVHTD